MRQSSEWTDLRDGIGCIRHHEKGLRLFNVDPSDAIHEELGAFFEIQNVQITADRTASEKPEEVAVLSNATKVLAVVDVSTPRELLEGVPTGTDGLGIADWEYKRVLHHLKETIFRSRETEQLLYVSREIEDRARGVGQVFHSRGVPAVFSHGRTAVDLR